MQQTQARGRPSIYPALGQQEQPAARRPDRLPRPKFQGSCSIFGSAILTCNFFANTSPRWSRS